MGFRGWLFVILALIAAILAVDVVRSTAQLDHIQIDATVDPSSVVADGLSKTTITVRVTEDGKPRVGDMLQIFLITGSGRVLPGWARTDNAGMVVTEFTPNPYSPYDPVDGAELQISDVSIGRLVEVRKDKVVLIPMIEPTK